MKANSLASTVGIGATDALTLRVSIAALVRVLFQHPEHGETMLALERRATLYNTESRHAVEVKSHPFGGALRIHDVAALQNRIGGFHFDSEQSRAEQDFRIFVRPSAWGIVKEFCLEYLTQPDDSVLESDPRRELSEEFAETLGIQLKPDQYTCHAAGLILENDPSPTENDRARGYPTARIYRIFEAHIIDSSLGRALIANDERYSDEALSRRARETLQTDGTGQANGVLTLPWQALTAFYSTLDPGIRSQPVLFQNYKLDETVAAVLDIDVPKYQRMA